MLPSAASSPDYETFFMGNIENGQDGWGEGEMGAELDAARNAESKGEHSEQKKEKKKKKKKHVSSLRRILQLLH
ncbi:hypothetical protein TWF696_003667 [Orbilia brochopaga]|uniref:Uncharacterized protein n=1 Tax=Orbilia brochopaga TaxID=3140254 RepID=A0AAV9V4G3_9PEZI